MGHVTPHLTPIIDRSTVEKMATQQELQGIGSVHAAGGSSVQEGGEDLGERCAAPSFSLDDDRQCSMARESGWCAEVGVHLCTNGGEETGCISRSRCAAAADTRTYLVTLS